MRSGLFRAVTAFVIILTVSLFNAGVIINPIYAQGKKDSLSIQQPTIKKDTKDKNKENSSSGTNKIQQEIKQETQKDTSKINPVQIDTSRIINQIDTSRTEIKVDSITTAIKGNAMTNTKLFIYILITLAGLALFYFIFVHTLFRTFHKSRSTRQSLMLSWDLFFIISIIWIFIVWGIVAGMWSSAAFMTVLIFLFIISLILSLIAIKSK